MSASCSSKLSSRRLSAGSRVRKDDLTMVIFKALVLVRALAGRVDAWLTVP